MSALPELDPVDGFKLALTLAAAEDPSVYDLRPEATLRAAGRILRLLTTVATGAEGGAAAGAGLARSLAEGWGG